MLRKSLIFKEIFLVYYCKESHQKYLVRLSIYDEIYMQYIFHIFLYFIIIFRICLEYKIDYDLYSF